MNLKKKKAELKIKKELLERLERLLMNYQKIMKKYPSSSEVEIRKQEIKKLCDSFEQFTNKNISIYSEFIHLIKKELDSPFGIYHDHIKITYVQISEYEKLIEKEEEKISEYEYKKFQTEFLKQDLVYKKELSEDNKTIKKLTLILAIGVLVQLLSYVFNALVSIMPNQMSDLGVLLVSVSFFILILFYIMKELNIDFNKFSLENRKLRFYLILTLYTGFSLLAFSLIFEIVKFFSTFL